MGNEDQKDLKSQEDQDIKKDNTEEKIKTHETSEIKENVIDEKTDDNEKPEEKQTKKCVKCGKEIDSDASFCRYCGEAQNAAPAAVAKEAKGIDKKLIAAIGVIVVLLLIIAFGAGKATKKNDIQEADKQESSKENNEEMTADDIEEYAEEAVEEEDAPLQSDLTPSEKRESQDRFTKLLITTAGDKLGDNYEYKWDYDKDIFYLNVTVPGAAGIIADHGDSQEVRSLWKELCDSEKELCKAMYNIMKKDEQLEGCHVCVNVVNDTNTDNILYSVYDEGTVLFDIMDQ